MEGVGRAGIGPVWQSRFGGAGLEWQGQVRFGAERIGRKGRGRSAWNGRNGLAGKASCAGDGKAWMGESAKDRRRLAWSVRNGLAGGDRNDA